MSEKRTTLATRYDFLKVSKIYSTKKQRYEYAPVFVVNSKLTDIMVRGGKLYALFNPDTNFWTKDWNEAVTLIDKEVYSTAAADAGEVLMNNPDFSPIILLMAYTDNQQINKFRNYVEHNLGDTFKPLNQRVIFADTEVKKDDRATFRLDYSPKDEPTPYFDRGFGTWYLGPELEKIMYLIGSVMEGDQAKIQKIYVIYGDPGTGKSTVINKLIVDTLFGGRESPYCTKFTAELLASRDSFGTGFLARDPLIAFDDDADLSRIESNTTLNLIASHEAVRVNDKYQRAYDTYTSCLLICGTNEPVQLSPSSGLNRRVIDIRPTGEKLSPDEYDDLLEHLIFEQSGIAYKCIQTYRRLGKNHYNKYQPENMLSMTSPFHNFVKDHYFDLRNGTTLANAYKLYCQYADESNFKTVITRYKFRDNLKLYFTKYEDIVDENGNVEAKNFFSGFKPEKIGITIVPDEPKPNDNKSDWLKLTSTKSIFDEVCSNVPAQYANTDEKPIMAWRNVTTKLKDLDTSRVHYVNLPQHHIVIDFDIKDSSGNKSMELNIEAAKKWPPTYAELSKSGGGIHLHYIYTGGNPDDLSRIFDDHIEVKVFTGDQSLRRRLSKCNNLPIAELSSGLKRKESKKMIDSEGFRNEKELASKIIKTCKKEYDDIPSTKSGIDFIEHLLKEAYDSGKTYDVRYLNSLVREFAYGSTNQKTYCLEALRRMRFCSDNVTDIPEDPPALPGNENWNNAPIVIFDIESYPGDEDHPALLVICWSQEGEDDPVISMINPSPEEVENLFKTFRMVGFNNRKYDNHICAYRAHGCTVEECNRKSQQIIAGEKDVLLREAYGWSYTDILDFASASNKMGLKKWEIKLGKTHMEMGIPWDKPVPEKLWPKVVEYCKNDVQATKAVWKYLQPDFKAREILAALSGLTVNDTTNQHTTKILTEGIRDPKQFYIYTDLSKIFPGYEFSKYGIDPKRYLEGVKIVSGKSIYKGIDPGEGGRKIGYPGMYTNVGLFDVASMHPHSAIRLNIFGDVITSRLEALVEARVAIKHGDYDQALIYISKLGPTAAEKVKPYLTGSEEELKSNAKALADALKTAINSVYGLTSAKFDNLLKDPRNEDNIVAKYGALFMINLEEEVTKRGYKVVHVSTDSIKIANVDNDIIEFVMNYGKEYGYTFEYEALYSKMCLINDAVYIAKVAKEDGKDVDPYWTATGKQFAVPYVFKTLFSHEPVIFDDMKEVFNVKEGAIYLDYNEDLEDPEPLEKELKKLQKKYKDGDGSVADTIVDLQNDISKRHNYQFIGNVGQFTPVVKGMGGGVLTCIRPDGRIAAVQGTKGYRWLESQVLTLNNNEDKVDKNFYISLVDDAVATISKFGDFEWFISEEDPFSKYMNIPESETRDEVPFEELPFK